MKISSLKPGKYIVAVSGGVDSVVLLDLLSKDDQLELVVAHFDHGIREDSLQDRKLVERLAKKLGLKFESGEGKLGKDASEATARQARYNYLRQSRKNNQAEAILTAHHQDDVIETIIINLLRGTNRKGLGSLKDTNELKRPLLDQTKQDILQYAKSEGLEWREDSTNSDQRYLRNMIRAKLMPKLSPAHRTKLLELNNDSKSLNKEIDSILESLVQNSQELSRYQLTMMDEAVAKELLIAKIQQLDGAWVADSKLVHKLWLFCKVGAKHKKFAISKKINLELADDYQIKFLKV